MKKGPWAREPTSSLYKMEKTSNAYPKKKKKKENNQQNASNALGSKTLLLMNHEHKKMNKHEAAKKTLVEVANIYMLG